MSEISPQLLLALLNEQRFFVQYQPIVRLSDQSIFAYEALSRFKDGSGEQISSADVYAALHDSPLSLFQVEYAQKKRQLQYAPADKPLFINLDQDSYFASGTVEQDNPFLTLFQRYSQQELIVELIENSNLTDAQKSLHIIDSLKQGHIATALDDCFAEQSMLSLAVIQQVDYIKLDKQVLANRDNSSYQHLVEAILQFAQKTNKRTILEGIETQADWLFAQQLQVDFVQGYYFSEQFINC